MKAFTPETAAAARATIEMQQNRYNREFLEDDHWKELAREAGAHLPMYYARPSDTEIRRWLKKLDVTWTTYLEAYGWESAEQFEKLNPTFSMRPLAGLILELWNEMRQVRNSCVEGAVARGLVTGDAKPKTPRYPRGLAKARRAPLTPIVVVGDAN